MKMPSAALAIAEARVERVVRVVAEVDRALELRLATPPAPVFCALKLWLL